MDPYSWLLLCSCILLICFSAYFSAVESSFAGANRVRLRSLAEEGNRRAARALRILDKFDNALISLLVGNNVVNTLCASLATVFALEVFTEGKTTEVDPLLTLLITVVTTVIIFIFGELVPKTLANSANDSASMLFAPSFSAFCFLIKPIALIFSGISALVKCLTGGREEPTVTEDELSTIIETVEEEGVIDEEQGELLQSALEFSETTVADVLTLWDDVSKVSLGMKPAEILHLILTTKHSRLPVVDGEWVVGVLMQKSFLKAYITGAKTDVASLMTRPSFVKLDAVIDELLEEMSENKCYLSVVLDREGKPLGVVTIEDFLEELVGEIFDEDEEVNPDFLKLGGNYFEVAATLSMGELFSGIGYTPSEPVLPSKTLRTFMLEKLGHLPEEDEELVFEALTFHVDELEDERVNRVTVQLETPELQIESDEGEDSEAMVEEEAQK